MDFDADAAHLDPRIAGITYAAHEREQYPPVRKTRETPKGNKGNARKAYFVETSNDYNEEAMD